MSSQNRSPNAELGLLDATMIGMGAMIGAGIFVLTGLAAEIAGPAAIIVFALNGAVTAFTGLSYAELAASIPKSGGGYAFVREIFDDFASFIMGWMLWFAYMIAGALYALGFAPNFLELLHVYGFVAPPEEVGAIAVPLLDVSIPLAFLLAFVAVLALVTLNAVSTAASGSAETIFTIIKVSILIVFVLFGLASPMFATAEFQPLFPSTAGAAAILPAMGLTFIAFEGYDLITTVTEEVKNPRENIPKAIFLSLIATVIVYLAVVTVAVGTLGAEGLADAGEAGSQQPRPPTPLSSPPHGLPSRWVGRANCFPRLDGFITAMGRHLLPSSPARSSCLARSRCQHRVRATCRVCSSCCRLLSSTSRSSGCGASDRR